MTSRPGARDLARLLRQRQELGLPSLFLDDATRAELLRAAQGARAAGVGGEAGARAGRKGAGGADVSEGAMVPASRGAGIAGSPAYRNLRATALECRKCRLAEGRTQVVFSDGCPDGRVMVVGEAPGAVEDRTGLAFVGPAGKLLDLLLESVGLSRSETVYICNVLKCRPPGNRNPLPDEIDCCAPYLRRQIEVVAPEAILAAGGFAGKWLTGIESPLGKLRGEVYSYEGVPVVVTYHPAALLRNPGWTRATWEDLQLVREILDRGT